MTSDDQLATAEAGTHCITCSDEGVPMRVLRIDERRDLALCEDLDVVENLFLGQELSPLRLDKVAMEVKSWELLRQLSAKIPTVRIPIASLSGGKRQTVAIARSNSQCARIEVIRPASLTR